MVDSWTYDELIEAFQKAPLYHIIFEAVLILGIFYLLFKRSYKPSKRDQLTEAEKDQLVAEWEPEPLVPELVDRSAANYKVVSKQGGAHVTVDGKECLNLATFNFLGMLGKKPVENGAVKALQKYGVGSCGPRGFYGTVDIHLELEDRLAKYMKTEEAILYSYGFSTVASAIPAYAKRSDVIFCDQGVCFAVQMGLLASRSNLKFFKHNDMEDLERLLIEQAKEDKKNPKKAKVTRRFLVVEGLYTNYGDIAPLKELLQLKYKYKVRLFMDESISFGVLGAHGKGLTEYFDVPVEEVDMITTSMENSLASIGGFCCGTTFVIDHQRLAGLGYCFSASLPPLLAAAAIESLNLMEENPDMFSQLQNKCRLMHELLSSIPGFKVTSVPQSSLQFLRLEESMPREEENAILKTIVNKAMEAGVAMIHPNYLKEERFLPPPGIRIAVTTELSEDNIRHAADCIREVTKSVLDELSS
ncbi:serine palmitoyltransferase 1-like [Ptychodera flava]|uniref:serine palmitoyltransferase 1-like n=1 Tax=Ptychodera flava TaxID=63121 RepID=UPI00396A8113